MTAKDVHHFQQYENRKNQLIDVAREKFERQQSIYKSQLAIQQEYLNYKEDLEKIKEARKVLASRHTLRNANWKKELKELE